MSNLEKALAAVSRDEIVELSKQFIRLERVGFLLMFGGFLNTARGLSTSSGD